jgi:Uma2 family endonuclease
MVVATPPDMVWEVRREKDRSWTVQYGRIVEHLRAGVPIVVVLDEKTASALVYRPAQRPQIFEKDQTLTIPDVLPGFDVPVARFFEE